MIRVSMYFLDAGFPTSKSRANDFTVAAPSGHCQSFCASKSIVDLPGNANQRSLLAPSDQKGALIEYGITPGATLWSRTDVNSPVSLNLRGNGGRFTAGGAFSSCAMKPPS